jgi:hypothetical protein
MPPEQDRRPPKKSEPANGGSSDQSPARPGLARSRRHLRGWRRKHDRALHRHRRLDGGGRASPAGGLRDHGYLGERPRRRLRRGPGRAIGASSSGRPSWRRARSRPGPSRKSLQVLVPPPTIFFRSSSTSVTHGTSKRSATFAASPTLRIRGTSVLRHQNVARPKRASRSTCGTGISHLPQRR